MFYYRPEDFHVSQKTIRGTQYVVFNFYSGSQTIFDRLGQLIEDSFERTNAVEFTEEFSVDSGIDTPEE